MTSKLSALKEKLTEFHARLTELTEKIGFIRNWKESRETAATAGPGAPDPLSLSSIYREGSTGTRLQVIAFYIFVAVALLSAGSFMQKILFRMRNAAGHEQLTKDISKGFADLQHKKMEEAEMLALGQFTSNIYSGQDENRIMSIELWIRVSDPATATIINSRNEVFREKVSSTLSSLFVRKVNLLQETGKVMAREEVREALNSALKAGKVEEVFIQNLVVQ
jgi:flagellar basal body-associated protein FliL